MSDWQKIETAPQDGTKVLILCADGEVYAARWDETFDFIEVGRSLLLIVGAIIVAVVLVVIWLHLVRYASTGGDL